MFSLSKGVKPGVRRSLFGVIAQRTSAIVRSLIIVAVVGLTSCAEKKPAVVYKPFYDFDSLLNTQIKNLRGVAVDKSVSINRKEEQIQFTPDSLQWASELDLFRELDQVNKPTFRDAYVVNDTRDTNSNLMVREIKARRPVPVSLMKFYYLRTPADLRKIEATIFEENSLYTNTRNMLLEFDHSHALRRYRIEGFQKMVMDDSVNFVIAGSIEP